MTRGSVAKEAISGARIEFLRQLREWERRARDDADDSYDGSEEEEEEELPNIQVEMARGVTPRMVARIPAEWLAEVVVELIPGGVLVMVDAETDEHSTATASISKALLTYVNAQYPLNLLSLCPYPDDFDYNGHHNHPDGVLLQYADPRPAPRLPILVIEVEVRHRDIPELITIATEYLQRESVQSVVGIKIFGAYTRVYRNPPPRVRKPALALVFERVPGQRAAPFAIRIAQEVSFGSTPIHRTVRENISTPPTRTLAASPDNPRAIPQSPYELVVIDPLDVYPSFAQMNPLDLVVPGPNFNLAVGAIPLPNFTLDLRDVFRCALRGWQDDCDRMTPQ